MSRPYANENAFYAVAHPIRRRIIDLLRQRERSVQDIAGYFQTSLATVSQHLRVLRTAGLIQQRRQKTQRIFRLQTATLAPIIDWVKPYQQLTASGRTPPQMRST
jgi:DNA-binding transcriptional ArsR family regulator